MNWFQLKSATLEEVIGWAEGQTWCQAMSDCLQDAEWHAEGDVWTHTKMVLQKLTELEEWELLSRDDQSILIFTALFHDVAKQLTSMVDPETGKIRSPKHAVKGEYIARAVLRDLNCDLGTREKIAKLVRYHGRPAFLMERDNPTHEVVKLSWVLNNRLLYLFALADTRGRDTDSISRPEENLNFWQMISEEAGCYVHPYPFATDHARFSYFRQSEPNLHYLPHEDYSCEVTLMVGLPGCGKDTWLSANCPDLPVVSLDEIRSELKILPTENQGRVAQLARERCREYLRSKMSFAFNATNTMKMTRDRWVDLFADYDARVRIVYLEPQFDVILSQNRSRSDSVPEHVLRKLAEKIEPPTWLECHELVWIIHGQY